MNLNAWTNRIANVRKIKNSKRPMTYQIARLHEEVSEMFMEIRKSKDLHKITYRTDDRGVEKPYGFIPELGDALVQILHIADLAGVDPEKAMEVALDYHERKQQANPTKKSQKGK